MTLLSVLPVVLLAIVMVWFIWPLVADPIARRLARQSETDQTAETLFEAWSKYGQGTSLLIRADRG